MKKTRDNFVIYKITNIINNKFYIGSAKYFASRKGNHLYKLRKNKHHCNHLQNSFNLYGEKNFKFEILEHSTEEEFIKREQYYIDILNPEYNILKLAYSSLGYKHSEECKKQMSINRKGKQNSLGRKLSDKTKQLIGSYQLGLKHSEERLNKKRIPIVQLNLNNTFVKEFKDSVTAAKELNLFESNIRSCCRVYAGFRKYPLSVGGYKFMYKEQFEMERIKNN